MVCNFKNWPSRQKQIYFLKVSFKTNKLDSNQTQFSISGMPADGSFRQANRPHDQRPRERGFRQRRGSKLCLPFVSHTYRIVKNKKITMNSIKSIKLRLPFVS